MRVILAAALGLSFACATTAPAPMAQGGSCASTAVDRPTVVYSKPDGDSIAVETVPENARVCADAEPVGFGFRHVKLADGKEGYVYATDLVL